MAAPTRNTLREPDALRPFEWWAIALVVAASVGARFVTTSPLWLDEALSVNIAAVPLGELADALRRDGHPPLYYALLHAWTSLVGDGDLAVRALSGVVSVAALPLAYVLGRRRAGVVGGACVLTVVAVAPWSVRYGTEARMYSLLFLLVLGGWLLADDLLARPDRRRWAALAVVTGAALLTHYWALYLGAAGASILGWRLLRRTGEERAAAVRVLSALAVGAVAFVPWVGVFLFQAANTGTPWADAGRPTQAFVELATGLGGGPHAEGLLFGAAVVASALIGLTATRSVAATLELDLTTVPRVRREVVVAACTLAIGLAVGLVGSAVFVARYAAVFLPMLLCAAGVGIAVLAPVPRRIAMGVVVGLAAVGVGLNVVDARSQGEEVADAIAADAGPADVVATCPDQLGPATLRYLPPTIDAVGLPALARPERIDWVDYAERNAAADPAEAAREISARADGAIWVVWHPGYRSYDRYCEDVLVELGAWRGSGVQVVAARGGDVFEPMALVRFPPPG